MLRDHYFQELIHSSKSTAADGGEIAPGRAARQSPGLVTCAFILPRPFGCGCAALRVAIVKRRPTSCPLFDKIKRIGLCPGAQSGIKQA